MENRKELKWARYQTCLTPTSKTQSHSTLIKSKNSIGGHTMHRTAKWSEVFLKLYLKLSSGTKQWWSTCTFLSLTLLNPLKCSHLSAQKHQLIPGAGLLAKGNITSCHAERTLNVRHCPLSLAPSKLGTLQRKILLEKWQREGKRSKMFFYCSSRKLPEQLKGHLSVSETHSTLQIAEIRARQALKKFYWAKCPLEKKKKKQLKG